MNAGNHHAGESPPGSSHTVKPKKKTPVKLKGKHHHPLLKAGILTLVLVVGHQVLAARTPEHLNSTTIQESASTSRFEEDVDVDDVGVEVASLNPALEEAQVDGPDPVTIDEEGPLPIVLDETVEPVLRETFEEVQKGDSILALLMHHNVSYDTALAVIQAARPLFDLARRIKPGDPMKMVFDDQNALVAFAYPVGGGQTLHVEQKEGRYQARLDETSFEPELPQILPLARPVEPVAVTGPTNLPTKVKNAFDGHTVVTESVQKNDTLATVLARRKVPHAVILDVARQSSPLFDLARSLKPGDDLELAMAGGRLQGIRYPIDTDRTFWMVRDMKGEFVPHIEKKIYERKIETVTATVEDSLIASGRKAGLSTTLLVNLAGIFEWDIDFARDLREGDTFTVSFESFIHEGKSVREGQIMAARFNNQGTVYEAIHYVDPTGRVGYFKPNGQNVRKMFIRAPVDFARISSLYNLNRKHPVLGYSRAHRGVDYAAPAGTPVRASGDGVIAFQGRRGSFGNLLVIRHNAKYSTAYAHLKGFVKDQKVGDRVSQKQAVAYLGNTGISTGPHLHYEVRVDNVAVDPLTINMPSADPVPKRFMADYLQKSAPLIAALRGEDEVAVLKHETEAYLKLARLSDLDGAPIP